MRVLVAHNRYQFSGGEDAVVRDEVEMLRDHGNHVELLEEDNDSIRGLRGRLLASRSVFYSGQSRRRMKRAIDDFHPEIVHIHNWFPMLSPSIIMEASACGVPTVQTLHNFRMLCANSLLYRNGAVCTDCVGKSLPLDGISHGCYRGSRLGSAVITAAYAFHRLAHTWDCVDLFIAVSGFEREVLVRGGLPAGKIAVKPNFVDARATEFAGDGGDYAVFVGRLSLEKGIRTLLSAWRQGKIPFRLKVIGDGPMAGEVRCCAASSGCVEYLGPLPHENVYREMKGAKFLVFPSEWFETFGRTVIEAFAQGTPVLAADLGCVQELVTDGRTGFLFAPGNVDALIAGALRFSEGADYERMRANCRNLFLSRFTAEINYTLLTDIYNKAIETRKLRQLKS